MEVRIQSVVVEFILNNTEALFSAKLNAIIRDSTGGSGSGVPGETGGVGGVALVANALHV